MKSREDGKWCQSVKFTISLYGDVDEANKRVGTSFNSEIFHHSEKMFDDSLIDCIA